MKSVEQLISIGSACRTRYQIDSFLKRALLDYKPTSFFFDYLMMGGVRCLSKKMSEFLKRPISSLKVAGVLSAG